MPMHCHHCLPQLATTHPVRPGTRATRARLLRRKVSQRCGGEDLEVGQAAARGGLHSLHGRSAPLQQGFQALWRDAAAVDADALAQRRHVRTAGRGGAFSSRSAV